MDRLLSLMIFLVLQGAAALTALRCQGPVCDWVAGGYWVAPAVRVPLVALAIVVVELVILAAVYPCNRLTARLIGRRAC
jgi:hypothetical protein